ncbi:MAG: alpha-mannosyltransferase [Gammaproteobacteria bacterium HGW-Gammaproteobacteria-8]|nr:MAG: alpha-mannosyltransferase [Gammaproteobacteria bacterium HGW-Gammaproteobacteria-8]
MKILLVTDAWMPQVNGVVRSLSTIRDELILMGHQVSVVSPEGRRTLPCPGYPEIRLTLRPRRALAEALNADRPDAIHIATEGPLGWAARRICRARGLRFTTSYHTRFPEYLRVRAPVPLRLSYGFMRRFHSAAERTLVRTETQRKLLAERGFRNLAIWPGAVDTSVFRPGPKDALDLPRPISMYMGRVAPEKNIEAFLDLDLPGSKVVIGGGPSLERYRGRYPNVHFLGYQHGEKLAETLAAADVFVFPSRTDTLGLVMLEAMACGVPVAAFPVPGPIDVVTDGATGALDEDLREAVFRALAIPGEACVEYAADFSWRASAERFVTMLLPAEAGPAPDAGRAEAAHPYNPEPCPSPLQAQKPASTSLPS